MSAAVTDPARRPSLGPGAPRADPRADGNEPDQAIVRTVAYASLFQYPLAVDELHRWLLGAAVSREVLANRLAELRLRGLLAVEGGMVYPVGCHAWIALRRERARHTEDLLLRHRAILDRVTRFPFVRLVALSGACARGNAADDDVDVFLVTKRNRAWAICLGLMLVSKWMGLRRTLCVNYVLDEDALALPERDLFTAAEIVGLRVLAGPATYQRFLEANGWLPSLFPNFWIGRAEDNRELVEAGGSKRREKILDAGPAPLFERLARLLLGSYLRFRWGGAPGVVLSRHRLKLHTRDHRARVMDAFERACADLPAHAENRPTLLGAAKPRGWFRGAPDSAGSQP